MRTPTGIFARTNRRAFLQTIAGATALAVMPRALLSAQSAPRLRLGMDTYSIRGLKWKAPQILDYAARLKLDVVMMSASAFESYEEAYLRKIREQAETLGLKVQPGFGCICPLSKAWRSNQGDPTAYLIECIRIAKVLGSPAFRILMGIVADRQGATPIPAMMDATLKSLRSVRSQALDAGVKIAIENHGDMQAWQVKALIEEAGRDFVGSCFDAGNPPVMLEDTLMALELLGPYVLTSHIRDSVVYEHPRGAAFQWVALGDGMIDFKQFVRRFQELCPHAPFLMEIITGEAPLVLPYLEADFWKELPHARTADFGRFLALVRKGQPFIGNMLVGGACKLPPEYQAALLHQQRIDLERSLEYAKKTLDVGVNWKA